MGRKTLATIVTTVLVTGLGMIVGPSGVSAHECAERPTRPGAKAPVTNECEDTSVAPNWRDPYLPLFSLPDHEDEDQRRDAQRWRDEWGCDTQHCVWVKDNTSVDGGQPAGVHAGTAADHSMFEVAHQSEDHGSAESNHDAHGGAIYLDVCLASEEGTSYEGQAGACTGPEDTQAGVTLVDHNPCGRIVPYVSCTDEYHVVRPLDQEYTSSQLETTDADVERMSSDPRTYLCGRRDNASCPVPEDGS